MKSREALLLLALGVFWTFASPALAQATDPFGGFANMLITWITGNLGKTLTLIGMIISVIALMVTHSWRIFLYGLVISVIIGGLVGIARTFFEAGAAGFGTTW